MTTGAVRVQSASPAPVFGLVAGETSGDNLGGPLIRSLAERAAGARFAGIAGPRMREAGCDAWFAADELAIMGLAEIVRHLPRLLRLRRDLMQRFVQAQPDAFIGIDAPEFNLRVAAALKRRGIPTVQYVSPQVWAWRQGRVRTIGRAVDLILCVLPFEPEFYARHDVPAVFVGHPLADHIPLDVDQAAARSALGLQRDGELLAVLPGSRAAEIARLGPAFAATLEWLRARRPALRCVAPMASDEARRGFEQALREHAPLVRVELLDGRSRDAIAASDAVLVASGTATLEAALLKRPMVVAYRVAPLTGWLLRDLKLVKAEYFSQPNLLAGRALVPEFFQEQVRPEVLGPALLAQLDRPDRAALTDEFTAIHRSLRRGASERAAEAVLGLVSARRGAR